MNAAIFDVDGTLLTGPHSSESLFVRFLLRRRVIGVPQIAAAGRFLLANAWRYRRHVLRKNKAYLAGLALDEVAALARAFADRDLARLIDRAVLQRIEEHRRAGDVILLLTGTPDFLARPLAQRIGADGWQGARYAVRDGRFAAAPPVRHPLGIDKIAAAADLCARQGAELAEAAAYADSIDDLALLARVARPVAVRPDRRLAREARARGWEIIAPTASGDLDAAPGATRAA